MEILLQINYQAGVVYVFDHIVSHNNSCRLHEFDNCHSDLHDQKCVKVTVVSKIVCSLPNT